MKKKDIKVLKEVIKALETQTVSQRRPVDPGFARFECNGKGCDNYLDVSLKILEKHWFLGWYCNVCGHKNWF